ncbi:MFS transporter [Streptomyces malaysiensis]|uniref:MFS transporter n=1 Tax=Streptomyces autolyticus TaxID=75293 RepID=A0ABM6H6B2_9ACTN|nr:MFS transporter [Streptomyces autolyticus]AQA09404.1 MFS transporter [Streptomyces autolyticus]
MHDHRRDRGDRHRAWPLYVGGFLGPYGSTMVTPMVHEVAAALHSTPGLAATAVTVYMVPFAALMLVSGTLAERWGRRRVLRTALVAFTAATALCALAPTMRLFLVARAFQGATNAFTTPLLVAMISDLVGSARLAKALSRFAAAQAAGQGVSPLFSGAAAALNWRLAFLVPGVCGLLLVCFPPSRSATRRGSMVRASWRSLADKQLVLACAVSFLAYFAAVGLTVLVVLRIKDRFGLGPVEIGLAGSSFGLAGAAVAPLVGHVLHAKGPLITGIAADAAMVLGLLCASLGTTLPVVVAGIVLVGAAVTGLRSAGNSLAVTGVPDNRAGAASLAMSAQFFGGAIATPVWLPVYHAFGDRGFALVAVVPLVSAMVLARVRAAPRGAAAVLK